MNLLTDALPAAIEADGRRHGILTDFRDWMEFSDMLHDRETDNAEKAVMMAWWVDGQPEITEGLVQAVLDFYKAAALFPPPAADDQTDEEAPQKPPVFDWTVDAAFVVADFRRYYGMDLLTTDFLHWWEFLSLFRALPEDSGCMKRIGYRSCDLSKIKNRAERDRIRKIQESIALPWEPEEDFGAELWNSMAL